MRCKIPARDLAQKLDQSICRYDKLPVYCRVMQKGVIHLYPLDNLNEYVHVIKPNDEKFDISGIPLGCIQGRRESNRVFYLSRVPWRRTKQGLQYPSLVIRKLGETNPLRTDPASIVFSTNFINMVMGNYPTLKDAIDTIRQQHKRNPEDIHQIAISIDIALSINAMGIIYVYFKNQFVGWMAPDTMTVIVPHSDKALIVSKFLSHELSWKVE